jgi:RNA-directed DNA polymerase
MDRGVLRAWLKAGFLEKGRFFPTTAGAPQGGVISPVLCNLVLDGLEGLLREAFPQHRRPAPKVNLIRYADDFLITGRSRELLEEEVAPRVREFLALRGLTLSEEKTRITHIQEGFDFLGQHVRKYGDKLLIKPSRKSQQSFRTKVNEVLRRLRGFPQEAVIGQLNPILRGWANYHRHVVSKRTFAALDDWIWHRVWSWARREHPHRSGAWIRERYYTTQGARQGVFCANKYVAKGRIRVKPREDEAGREIVYPTLFRLESVPIVRHVKIRGEAHPFDRRFEEYLEQRWRDAQGASLNWLERRLFTLQAGRCPRCGERLEARETWDIHHLIFRVHGGDDALENLELLHLNCHRQLHHEAASGSSLSRRPSERLEPRCGESRTSGSEGAGRR